MQIESVEVTNEELHEFKLEAQEAIQGLEANLLMIEKGTSLSCKYDEMTRCLHNVKGGAMVFGLRELEEHVHLMESALVSIEFHETIASAINQYLFEGIDLASLYLTSRLPAEHLYTQKNHPIPDPSAPSPETTSPESDYLDEINDMAQKNLVGDFNQKAQVKRELRMLQMLTAKIVMKISKLHPTASFEASELEQLRKLRHSMSQIETEFATSLIGS